MATATAVVTNATLATEKKNRTEPSFSFRAMRVYVGQEWPRIENTLGIDECGRGQGLEGWTDCPITKVDDLENSCLPRIRSQRDHSNVPSTYVSVLESVSASWWSLVYPPLWASSATTIEYA